MGSAALPQESTHMLLHHSEAFNTKAYFSPRRTNYLGVKHLFTAPVAPQPGCEAAQLFQF